MQTLGFLTSSQPTSHGFSLVELLMCWVVMAGLLAFAAPHWQHFQDTRRVEAARDQLAIDLQSARLRAVQQGEVLQLARRTDCAWSTSSESDWSCGWQLRLKVSGTVLHMTSIDTPLKVTFAKSLPLEISARGDLGTVGERWLIQSLRSAPKISMAVCINSASRVRWVSGESCA